MSAGSVTVVDKRSPGHPPFGGVSGESEYMHEQTEQITELILQAADKAREETRDEPEPEFAGSIAWPVECSVGPGLEGAVACESAVGYVNGAKGQLIYRGYDIFDLCALCSYEEVSYLLIHGELPTTSELAHYKATLASYRHLPDVMRLLMSFPVEQMNTMAALRLGTNLMRQKQTYVDREKRQPSRMSGADEDSDPMEVYEGGRKRATFEFKNRAHKRPRNVDPALTSSEDELSCYHLIAGMPTIMAAIMRLQSGSLPLEPDEELSHAANLIYMTTGKRPTPIEERIMDIALILHADHGMNASTFAAMVVASTLSDIYFAVGAGIAALNGPLHGGANEEVLAALRRIGSLEDVESFYRSARSKRRKIMGFGHRVYKAYDPRARILRPIVRHLAIDHPEFSRLFDIAEKLEALVVADLGRKKQIFPNVDFFSGLVYGAMGLPASMFTPLFAVSRVAGWTARILEYLKHNRIFRPRAVYTGRLSRKCVPVEERP